MIRTVRRASFTTVVLLFLLVAPLAVSATAAQPDWPTVVRSADWHLRQAQSGGGSTASWTFGRSTDLPVLGDWDGDGVATPGVYRDGSWYLTNSLTGGAADRSFHYGGRENDFPIVGDWDGDGIDTVGVIRGGTWHLVNAFRGGDADVSFTYGRVAPRGSDIPLVGDWDGDGVDTVGIVRDGEWHLRDENAGGSGDVVFTYGRVGPRGDDVAIAGDWDGDGLDTVGVVRGKSWMLRNANAGGGADVSFEYGREDDWKAVQGGFSETTQRAGDDAAAAPVDVAALSPREAIRAWFPDQPDKAVRVADCESGLNPRAYNSRGFYGLFQISGQWHRAAFERVTGQRWEDGIFVPYYNAQYARTVYESNGGWSPWPTCGR